MGYIDKTYYDGTYMGLPITDQDMFDRLEARASDIIDQLIRYALQGVDLTTLHQLIQDNVKKAVASQVEYMFSNGGELVSHGGDGMNTVKIGNFNYTEGNSDNNLTREQKRISPAVLEFLRPTGLMNRAVNVRGSTNADFFTNSLYNL